MRLSTEGRTREGRFAIGLGIALLVHAVGVGVVATRRLATRPRSIATAVVSSDDDEGTDFTIDETPFETPTAAIAETPPDPSLAAVAERDGTSAITAPRAAAGLGSAEGLAAMAAGREANAEGAPGAGTERGAANGDGTAGGEGNGTWSLSVAPIDLGLGKSGSLGAAGRGAELRPGEPELVPKPDPGGLNRALTARDRELGMGRGGPVLAAVEQAIRDGNGPDGKATFVVRVDRNGTVDVNLRTAERNPQSWRELAAGIQAQMKKARPIRFAPKSDALEVTIQVEADLRWPDGRRVEDTSKPGGFYAEPGILAAGQKKPVAAGKGALPDVGFEAHGKICDLRISLATLSIGGGCSPENAGVAARRVVHGRIVDEQSL